ncbi:MULTISPECIES: flavin reductase family protein [unclassified Streptomyces]|uniref:flavin reductase family protein n=1 Tax=unclassified Streptomyces TaxID=2593676 RepID=UPI002E18F83A|nr:MULTISPECIES: flavin reductase family protein [unclassified Streptomyces]
MVVDQAAELIEQSTELIDQRELRAIFGRFATGVTVITANYSGELFGMTVNSFASLSLDPPLALFCLRDSSSFRAALDVGSSFTVNILSEEQRDIAALFASGVDRFLKVNSLPGRGGSPVLTESLAYVTCEVAQQVAGGDHVIIIGKVVDIGLLRRDGRPLGFFAGAMQKMQPYQ